MPLGRGRRTGRRAGAAGGPPTRTRAWSVSGVLALIGTLAALGLAIGYIADYSPGTTGLTHVTDVVWIANWASTTSSASTA